MATYNKFLQFTKDLIDGVHDMDAHVFKVVLSNTAPVNTNTVLSNITQIANGNGYTTGGATTTITTSTSSGTAKATATDVTWTASGGSIGPFQYVVIYNDTPSSPADPLIAWYDNGSPITLNSGDSFTVDFDGTNGFFTVT